MIDPMDAPFDDEPEDPPEEAARTAEARAQVARRETMSTDELLRGVM